MSRSQAHQPIDPPQAEGEEDIIDLEGSLLFHPSQDGSEDENDQTHWCHPPGGGGPPNYGVHN